ncbi:hypothetical protein PCC9214_05420 (plasmid) [Planktothrix tepida]|uniref:Uncharacterized protein n=2 Tax=Planktothrix TaxID=54304 RepID=A0A1J1LCX0_9CYAN|nr:hypothetical protein PCC9214_05420 [Planktothrix tepida]CUR30312.1 conserved hypothetical protein [Planktothrix tepida PCC 9214]
MNNSCILMNLILPSGCTVEFVQAERAYRITCPDVYTAQWVFNNRQNLYSVMKQGEMLRIKSQGFEQITYPLA